MSKYAIFTMVIICLSLYSVYLSIIGIVISFKASIIIGMGSLVIEPLPFIFGVLYKWGDKNIPEQLQIWLNLPF